MITNPVLGGIGKQTGSSFFGKFLPALIALAFAAGVLFFFANIIIGAIKWITSQGDKSALESARGQITSALVGIIILFGVFAVLTLIEKFFGITILTLDIAPLVIQ